MSFKEILQFVRSVKQIKRVLFPMPFCVAKVQAMLMNFFGIYALTKDQVNLVQINNTIKEDDVNIDDIETLLTMLSKLKILCLNI